MFVTGNFLWEKINLDGLCVSRDLSEALTEGLTALTQQEEVGVIITTCEEAKCVFYLSLLPRLQIRPLEFLSLFLTRWSKEKGGEKAKKATGFSSVPDQLQVCVFTL